MRDLRDMPIVTVEQVIRFREAVFAEIERLQRENEELRKRVPHKCEDDGGFMFAKCKICGRSLDGYY